jgi:inner membrane transporter RhtA
MVDRSHKGDANKASLFIGRRVPPLAYFAVSALFHYLGPALAVLLFARLEPLGVAWLRIASAAIVFCVWRRPWHLLSVLPRGALWTIVTLGGVLGLMNSIFYLAIDRLPLGTVGAIEFLGPIGLAAFGQRVVRNWVALLLATLGVYALSAVRIEGAPLGYLFAFANCALFVLYIILGHRLANSAGPTGIDRLALAMFFAMLVSLPLGFAQAMPAFDSPQLLAAAIGVGICSSVVPYVCDQLAMARMPRATFALLLALLPAIACAIGILVLGQVPSRQDLLGIALVVIGVAVHQPEAPRLPSVSSSGLKKVHPD